MKKLLLIFLVFYIIIFSNNFLKADKCKDYLAFASPESITSFGIDTTGHWWALASNTNTNYRLIVDGKEIGVFREIKSLTFSNDGNRWACLAKDNVRWFVVANDTLIELPASDAGELAFSPDSKAFVYSYFEGENEVIVLPNRRFNVINRIGHFYPGFGGNTISFLGIRGEDTVININGTESQPFQSIIPMGYWLDGQMVYAAKNGGVWEVYKNFSAISESYAEITEAKINVYGTVAAILARQMSGNYLCAIFSDEYYDPLVSKPYDFANALVLHPSLPLAAFRATISTNNFIALSNTDYYGGQTMGYPYFTYDGAEMYFFGCDIDCFVNINGRKYSTNMQIDLMNYYPMKPDSRTIAYATGTSMVVRDLEKNMLYSGMMVDQVSQPIYNWRSKRYEALGLINQRLFLLTCEW
ncbi:MAG: hypothetical protein EPN82_12730 [Bacteroidetes bacterium]|nr:MAG: hypothetical protein EPN82_12730 [Bacteroidota bacterium]